MARRKSARARSGIIGKASEVCMVTLPAAKVLRACSMRPAISLLGRPSGIISRATRLSVRSAPISIGHRALGDRIVAADLLRLDVDMDQLRCPLPDVEGVFGIPAGTVGFLGNACPQRQNPVGGKRGLVGELHPPEARHPQDKRMVVRQASFPISEWLTAMPMWSANKKTVALRQRPWPVQFRPRHG